VEIGYELFRGHSGLKDKIVLLVENCTLTNVMTGKRKWHLTARKQMITSISYNYSNKVDHKMKILTPNIPP
jgi:hypothetical protein